MNESELLAYINSFGGVNTDEINAFADSGKTGSSGYVPPNRVGSLPVGKQVKIRFLPAKTGETLLFSYWQHFVGKSYHRCVSPKNGCIICRARKYAEAIGKTNEVKWFSGKQKFVFNVYDIAEKKVKILELSKTVAQSFANSIKSYGDVTNLHTGSDFIYARVADKQYALTNLDNKTPLVVDANGKLDLTKAAEILKTSYDLSKTIKKPNAEEAKKAVNAFISLNDIYKWEKRNGIVFADQSIDLTNTASSSSEPEVNDTEVEDISDLNMGDLDVDDFVPEDMPF